MPRSAATSSARSGWARPVKAMRFFSVVLVMLLWLGTREVLAGRLTIGELVSFLGYGLYLIGPIRTFFEFAQKITRAMVSARKAIAIFDPEPPWRDVPEPAVLDPTAPLVDEATGLIVRPAELTIVVSAVPEESAGLAEPHRPNHPPETEPGG